MSKTYLSGVGGSGKAHYLFKSISEKQADINSKKSDLRGFAFVKDEELNSFYGDLKTFFNADDDSKIEILLFPSDDAEQRAFAIDKIKKLKKFVICASDISMGFAVSNPKKDDIGITVVKNRSYDLNKLVVYLSHLGYSRVNFVEDRMQFAVRGDIVDVWAAANVMPLRIFFEYDNVGAIRTFDPGSQLSNAFIDEVKILPLTTFGAKSTIEDYFKHNKETESIVYFDFDIDEKDLKLIESCEVLINNSLNHKAHYQGYKSFTGFQGDVSFFVKSLKSFAESGILIKVYYANDGEMQRISDIFHENNWNYKSPEFLLGNLSQGFYLEQEKLVCISSREMLYKKKPVNFPKIKGGRRLEGIWEISSGDYVVHEKYGIGRYVGLKTILRDSSVSEYLCIEYRNDDKLYVPPDEIKTVKKYVGIEGVKPKLYSMDTLAWERVKSKARQAAKELAKELLKLYAQRSLIKRTPFSYETTWEKELKDSFPYKETSDQLKAIEDVNSDFHKPCPMERLVCGDVGFGKTEVAVRASFKVVQEGMQVAVLAPTTVLAQQHYNTFHNRLSIFPTKIAVLSRFQTKSKQKEVLESLKTGNIDIIVGTHRLLQKDVNFKNLGLLIIDEEHRFGVKQKEKIKSVKKNVDILMLSATPIPRTLSSALSGFRDLSLIETPPFGKLPVETSLSIHNDTMIKKIIEAEVSRNGQVFYVYNKVGTILTKAESIKKLVPDIRLGVIHGKMKSKDIENIMWEFTNLELDVLLATTIIESGLDIPSVNTMIIEEAENFGLAQLYQLRGRIGRGSDKAYCYLFYKGENLSDEAVKRLEAIKEFSELGSGFKFALKDLEIRGAGGILSSSQHGFVRDIGYDMFAKLLEEEGEKVKNGMPDDEKESRKSTSIDLCIDALIPNTYVEDENIRILFYRKLSDATNENVLEKVKNELIDRFGKIPKEAQMLFKVASLRISAETFNIETISEDNNYIYLYFYKEGDFSRVNIAKFIADYLDIVEFISGKHYAFKLKKSKITESSMDYLAKFLSKLHLYMKELE
ncbi:MAG: transcription-repair coupling factor [Endomicrobium sp.]|nr:transcription-repair coupling factor [Endomicrobium sp.]